MENQASEAEGTTTAGTVAILYLFIVIMMSKCTLQLWGINPSSRLLLAHGRAETQLLPTAQSVWCTTVTPGDDKIYTSKGFACVGGSWEEVIIKSVKSTMKSTTKTLALRPLLCFSKLWLLHWLVALKIWSHNARKLCPSSTSPKGRNAIWSKQSTKSVLS